MISLRDVTIGPGHNSAPDEGGASWRAKSRMRSAPAAPWLVIVGGRRVDSFFTKGRAERAAARLGGEVVKVNP